MSDMIEEKFTNDLLRFDSSIENDRWMLKDYLPSMQATVARGMALVWETAAEPT